MNKKEKALEKYLAANNKHFEAYLLEKTTALKVYNNAVAKSYKKQQKNMGKAYEKYAIELKD